MDKIKEMPVMNNEQDLKSFVKSIVKHLGKSNRSVDNHEIPDDLMQIIFDVIYEAIMESYEFCKDLPLNTEDWSQIYLGVVINKLRSLGMINKDEGNL